MQKSLQISLAANQCGLSMQGKQLIINRYAKESILLLFWVWHGAIAADDEESALTAWADLLLDASIQDACAASLGFRKMPKPFALLAVSGNRFLLLLLNACLQKACAASKGSQVENAGTIARTVLPVWISSSLRNLWPSRTSSSKFVRALEAAWLQIPLRRSGFLWAYRPETRRGLMHRP